MMPGQNLSTKSITAQLQSAARVKERRIHAIPLDAQGYILESQAAKSCQFPSLWEAFFFWTAVFKYCYGIMALKLFQLYDKVDGDVMLQGMCTYV